MRNMSGGDKCNEEKQISVKQGRVMGEGLLWTGHDPGGSLERARIKESVSHV